MLSIRISKWYMYIIFFRSYNIKDHPKSQVDHMDLCCTLNNGTCADYNNLRARVRWCNLDFRTDHWWNPDYKIFIPYLVREIKTNRNIGIYHSRVFWMGYGPNQSYSLGFDLGHISTASTWKVKGRTSDSILINRIILN